MDPKSSLKKRLSKSFTQPPILPSSIADAHSSSSSSEELELSDTDNDEKMERTATPRPTPDIPLLVQPTNSNVRPNSVEVMRRRRELAFQRRLSSDTESHNGMNLQPPTRRRKRSRTPSRGGKSTSPVGRKTPKEGPEIVTDTRSKSPAPLAKVDSDDESANGTTSFRLSFLSSFLAAPLRRLFNRPKITPVTVSNDESSEQMEMSCAMKKTSGKKERKQIFHLPSARSSEFVGSRPPSVGSTDEDNYDILHVNPPDLESRHSSDLEIATMKRHLADVKF